VAMLTLILLLHESLVVGFRAQTPSLTCAAPISRSRTAVLLQDTPSQDFPPAAINELDNAAGVVAPTTRPKPPTLTQQLSSAQDSEAVLKIVDAKLDTFKAFEVATALHRVAVRNKKKRARRDAILRDERLDRLFDAATVDATNFSARCVSDVLWSMATLQHLPARMLVPVLTSVNTHLDRGDFKGYQLATVVWSLGKLATKPTRLLERIEEQAITRLGDMNVQNAAILLSGFARLGYKPTTLMPHVAERLLEPDMLDSAKHVEVADIGYALGVVAKPGEYRELLGALAARAAPATTLRDMTSRQICILIDTFAKLEATAVLPRGLLDAWIGIVKIAHSETQLLARDASNLESSLRLLGEDPRWIKKSEMLSTWLEQIQGRATDTKPKATPTYTDEELRGVFDLIDTDGSGQIDLEKLKVAVDKVGAGAKMDDGALRKMMDYGTAEGEITLSFDEFKRIMTGEAPRQKIAVV